MRRSLHQASVIALEVGRALGLSARDSQALVVMIALMGLVSSMPTTIILKICTPEPDMYSIKAFMGTDLAGAKATSHARFCRRASTSSLVGALRVAAALLARCAEEEGMGARMNLHSARATSPRPATTTCHATHLGGHLALRCRLCISWRVR